MNHEDQKTPLFYQPPESWKQLFPEPSSPAIPVKKQLELLRAAFTITEEDVDRAAVIDELAITAFRFAEEQHFTQTKSWAFLSILFLLHRSSMSELFFSYLKSTLNHDEPGESKPLKLEESFTLFKRLLVAHSIQRPPYSVRVFGLDESKLLTRFMTHTYYLHYRLYLYVFTKRRLLDLSQKQFILNVAPDIPALAIATAIALPASARSMEQTTATAPGGQS